MPIYKGSLGWSAPVPIHVCSGESHLWLLQLPGGEFSLLSCEIQQISRIFPPAVRRQRPTCLPEQTHALYGPWASPPRSLGEYLWDLGNHCLRGTLPLYGEQRKVEGFISAAHGRDQPDVSTCPMPKELPSFFASLGCDWFRAVTLDGRGFADRRSCLTFIPESLLFSAQFCLGWIPSLSLVCLS